MSETSYLVEQAVFSVNAARRSANGRNEAALIDASAGTAREDLNAALDWATRVETFEAGYDPLNLFFLSAPSGAFAIGRLTPAAREAEKGAFYFQMFFIERDAFFQCGANPVALLHLALNTGRFALYRPDAKLEAFRLETRAPWIDQEDLRRTTERLGTRALTTLIQTLLEAKRTAFVSDYNAFLVVAALFELTPIYCRPSLTFAVGARFSGEPLCRLIGATAKRGDERWNGETGAAFCDLRDVVENDDAYPIEHPWAALVELALTANRVDYLYERTAEEFFLYLKRRDDGEELETSSDEAAEMGLRWRLELEDAIRGDRDETSAVDRFDDEAADDENVGETETFFDGDFEGGWRDSDGDEGWQGGETDAAPARPTNVDRVAPEFVFIFEPTETESSETTNDREKGRESDAAQKKDDNKEKRNGKAKREPGALLDDIFAGDSFAEEWDAIEGRRGEDGSGASDPEEEQNGEKKTFPKKKRGAEAALEAVLRVLYKKNGVVGAGENGLKLIAGSCDKVLELVQKKPESDKTPGLDGLANLGALISERGAEALEGLKQIARRDGEENDDERQALERNARRLRLAPFAALSAEYPGWNEELRRFDVLFDDACSGNEAAAQELRGFWRRWRRKLDERAVAQIHAAYDERLRGRLRGWLAAEGADAFERTERILTALALYSALFIDDASDGEKK